MINCPGCGGNLKFNIAYQLMHCDFCGNNYDPYDFDQKSEDGQEVTDYDITIFTCPECAGEIESTDTDITGFCPFCGASTIFYSRLSKEEKPDYIIPFAITKEDCKKAYANKANKALFLPKAYKDPAFIDSFRGIYMPYWSYDIDMNGDYLVQGEIDERHGDYIHHKHYDLTGEIDSFYHGINYDASSSFSDEISERIAPYDIKKKKAFTAGFLSGFYGDTADVGSGTYQRDALELSKNNAYTQLGKVPNYSKHHIKRDAGKNDLSIRLTGTDRTLFPVWFMSYRHKDRVAYVTVNAQTGKVAADMPISIPKYFAFCGVVALGLFLLLNFLFTFKPITTAIITGVIALIALFMYLGEKAAIEDRDNGKYDKGKRAKGVKIKNKKTKQDVETFPIIACVIAFVLPVIDAIFQSVKDYVHYGISIISSILIGIAFVYLIKNFNLLCTRRLPQFDKKGGDDNA